MIKVSNVKKSFDELDVLKDITFTVNKGDVVAIIGPSGSGKSTLLRGLINLEKFDNGSVKIKDEYILNKGVYAHSNKLKEITSVMGMVFQNFNLFPHLSVCDNLIKPLILTHKVSKQQAKDKALELLKKVGLEDKLNKMPSTLSGGQKQRVAIARSLMLDPDIILFDEPTSALDPQLTNEVLSVIKSLANDKMTMVIVTHEMNFARDVANKVLFMSHGKIIEEGTPDEIFNNPKNDLTKQFIGA